MNDVSKPISSQFDGDYSDLEPTDDPYIFARKRLASSEKYKIDVRDVQSVERASNAPRESCFVEYKDGSYVTPHVESYRMRKRIIKRKKRMASKKKNDLDDYIEKKVEEKVEERLEKIKND